MIRLNTFNIFKITQGWTFIIYNFIIYLFSWLFCFAVRAQEDNDKLIKSYDVKLIEGYDVLSVIDIMSRFPDVVDIQVFGCKLLTLATDGTST